MERRRIQVQGMVQGVGFRPFIYSLARQNDLMGTVRNDSAGVTIEVQGEPSALNAFQAALHLEPPPLASIEQVRVEVIPLVGNGREFTIIESRSSAGQTLVSPDVATCSECLRELFDPADRRYRYPFINCTHCGPRFTIIRKLPYDRPQTTMAGFAMCSDCQREYDDPADRRFHAQPVACPACGPELWLSSGNDAAEENRLTGEAALEEARRLLRAGKIVAVKGAGGFHLACDATNEAAVATLRRRKRRPDKPLALMVPDLKAAEVLCEVSGPERQLLSDRRRPIVLLSRKPAGPLAPSLAPGQRTVGVMLPYTPLHHLLLAPAAGFPTALVMTSGNLSGEPIVYREADAFGSLDPIADAFLGHNRPIQIRCDDSVVQVVGGRTQMLRRSRGYAPQPLSVDFRFVQPLLAVGAHLKNSFCLGQERTAYLSQHIGDLANLETLRAFRDGVAHFQSLFGVEPAAVAHDLHPDYLSTREALSMAGVPALPVQHHHAHIASVLAEHRLNGQVIGVAFDGTGYGPDGTIWGGEFFITDRSGFRRVAHLATVPLPGGEKAVRQPWRVTAAWLHQLYGDAWLDWSHPFVRELDRSRWSILRQMIERDLNCPLTSSMGRLFDAVAALVGVRGEVTYEGQAAVELEALADPAITDSYPFGFQDSIVDPRPMFDQLQVDLQSGVPVPVIAARFHNGLAQLIATVCLELREAYKLNLVALSGGVFQNSFLLARTLKRLEVLGFQSYINQQVPPNDGGIALGQAAVAAARIEGAATHPDRAPARVAGETIH